MFTISPPTQEQMSSLSNTKIVIQDIIFKFNAGRFQCNAVKYIMLRFVQMSVERSHKDTVSSQHCVSVSVCVL